MTTTLTPNQFWTDYPEFTGIDPTNEIARADAILSLSAFGTLRDDSIELLVAHRLCIRNPANGALQRHMTPGIENSQNVSPGGVSIGVAHSRLVESERAWQADLSRTDYGLELLGRMDMTIPGVAPTGITPISSGAEGWTIGVGGVTPPPLG